MSHYKQWTAVLTVQLVVMPDLYLFSRLTRPLKTGTLSVDDLIRRQPRAAGPGLRSSDPYDARALME